MCECWCRGGQTEDREASGQVAELRVTDVSGFQSAADDQRHATGAVGEPRRAAAAAVSVS